MRHENKIIVLSLALWLVVFSTVQSQDAEFREGELIVNSNLKFRNNRIILRYHGSAFRSSSALMKSAL